MSNDRDDAFNFFENDMQGSVTESEEETLAAIKLRFVGTTPAANWAAMDELARQQKERELAESRARLGLTTPTGADELRTILKTFRSADRPGVAPLEKSAKPSLQQMLLRVADHLTGEPQRFAQRLAAKAAEFEL